MYENTVRHICEIWNLFRPHRRRAAKEFDCRVQLKCDGTRWRTGRGSEGETGVWSGVASTLRTTSEHVVCPGLLLLKRHTSAASSRLNWRPPPCRIKWTRPFRRKTKSGFCACAITFDMQSKHRAVRPSRLKIFSVLWTFTYSFELISLCLSESANYLAIETRKFAKNTSFQIKFTYYTHRKSTNERYQGLLAIPLQAWTDPEGSTRLTRSTNNRHMKVVRLSALCTGRLYP
jgi:hypothetical protein